MQQPAASSRTASAPAYAPHAGMAVFLNSLGELTAYDYDGSLLWQVCS